MQSLWICSLSSHARDKLVEVVSLFTEFHVYHNFISITSFSLISVFTSLILVLTNVFNIFNCVLLLQCSDFNCGFQGVSSQSQHEFGLEHSRFVDDWTNHVGAA